MSKAIALFGSAARGDHDSLSDYDVLVIGDNAEELAILGKPYLDRGANISSYTWRRFQRLAETGSLFVQHIKLEGRILSDPDGQLAQVLERFRPSISYQSTAASSRCVLNTVTLLPANPRGFGWAFDAMLLGFRGVLVATLADEARYVFSYDQLVKVAANRHSLNYEEAQLLYALRMEKAAYRAAHYDRISSFGVLKQTADVVSKCCRSDCRPEIGTTRQVLSLMVDRLGSPDLSGYVKLRSIELGLAALHDVERWRSSGAFSALHEQVSNPAAYSFLASIPDSAIVRSAKQLFTEAMKATHE